jgi:hypothetical protein
MSGRFELTPSIRTTYLHEAKERAMHNSPRAINSVFGFFLSNLDCQRLPVVGIKEGPTSRPE